MKISDKYITVSAAALTASRPRYLSIYLSIRSYVNRRFSIASFYNPISAVPECSGAVFLCPPFYIVMMDRFDDKYPGRIVCRARSFGMSLWRWMTSATAEITSTPVKIPSATAETISTPVKLPSATAETISTPVKLPSATAETISTPGKLPSATAETISTPGKLPSAMAETILTPGKVFSAAAEAFLLTFSTPSAAVDGHKSILLII